MKTSTRDLTVTAIFAALSAAGALIRIPFGSMSITLQFFFAALGGLLLGPRLGALSQLLYVLLGLLGLPVFSQGGGLSYLLMPSCGFLFGLMAVAWVTGRLAGSESAAPRRVAACLAGLAALYAVGLPYLYLVLRFYMGREIDLGALLWSSCIVYLPFDVLKIALLLPATSALGRVLPPIGAHKS